jgi:hypothetical protein
MNPKSIRLQQINPNFKTVHACAYTVPRSVEQQLRKEIARLVKIEVLEETIPLDGLSQHLKFQEKWQNKKFH